MNLEKLVAVSTVSGVMRLAVTKNNGLILEDVDSGKKRFFASRSYDFTPLESIAIYVDSPEESVPLSDIFAKMKAQIEESPVPSVKADATTLQEYFTVILPDYSRSQVYLSDIKKVIKWFTFLNDRNLLQPKTENVDAIEVETTEIINEEAATESEA